MNITKCASGVLEGLYHNTAPDSSDECHSLVGSMGKDVSTTLGFVVNFEVSMDMVTYLCGSFAISRKRSASTSFFTVFFLCSPVLVLMHALHSLFVG